MRSGDGTVHVHEEGDVRVLTIDRPASRNALTPAMYEALAAALGTLDDAAAPRVALLLAAGESFCAGNDLGDFAERAAGGGAALSADSPQRRLLHALAALAKPLVVAVDGAAIGIGFTLLLHADLVVATPRASFGAPFAQLGLCPEAGSSLLLPALLGRQRAMEVFLLGRKLDADEALAAGLVNRIVPPDELEKAARDCAEALAALPPRAVRETRRLVDSPPEPLPSRVDRELEAFAGCLGSAETRATIAAVRERMNVRGTDAPRKG